ncbi:hypothetical protein [Hwangdonia lutea]|uniref:Uncharacterized protein n=1 Tax=Hwangdonia lutea TaxID=3075823 RepID=A0AA97ENH5_9FLAO|nr:hypothetical protein [Hwangdonia sp. SCSIO 19198]WOD43654.1 hypothetical protein RNZ46_16845 [Hwangdonia sp. SCSIO 19198]
MTFSKVLIGLISLVYSLFVGFEFFGHPTVATHISVLIIPLIVLLYFVSVKKKTLFFSLFLIFYAIPELLLFVKDAMVYQTYYYICNTLCVAAYVFLLIEIYKSINFKEVLKRFKVQVIVLAILSLYMGFVLFKIISPSLRISVEYILEITYNILILLVLSVSLLNYFYKDDKKSLFLFLGALCIVFSEVINIAYIYLANQNLLNFMFVSLFVLAFFFLLQQSKLDDETEDVLAVQ